MQWELLVAVYLGGAFAILMDGITTFLYEKHAPVGARNWPRLYFCAQLTFVFVVAAIWPIDGLWNLSRATFGMNKHRTMEREVIQAAWHVYNAVNFTSTPPTSEEAETLKLTVHELHATVHRHVDSPSYRKIVEAYKKNQ